MLSLSNLTLTSQPNVKKQNKNITNNTVSNNRYRYDHISILKQE